MEYYDTDLLNSKSKDELILIIKELSEKNSDLTKRINVIEPTSVPDNLLKTPIQEKALLDLGSLGSNSIHFLRAADNSMGVEVDTSTAKIRQNYLNLERGLNAFKSPDVVFYKNLFKSNFVLDYDDDSPGFRAKLNDMDDGVDDLRNHLQKLVDKCRHFCEKGNSYSESGRKFCSLLLNLQDDVWVSRLGDMGPLLSNFGFVLDEIQLYTDGVLSSLETTFSAPMEEFVKREVKSIKKLKSEMEKSGEEYEVALSKFLTLKNSTDSETKINREKELNMHRKKFELNRYDMVVELNSVASKKKFQLCERICSALYAYLGYFHQCHTLLATIEPAVRQLTTELNSARKDFVREQLLMSARRTQLQYELNEARSEKSGRKLKYQRKIRKYFNKKKTMKYLEIDSSRLSFHEDSDSCKETEILFDNNHNCFKKESWELSPKIDPEFEKIDDLKSGYLWKRSTNLSRTWQRRWFYIREGKLYYANTSDKGEKFNLVSDLMISTVKLHPETDLKFTFEVISPGQRKYVLQAESEHEFEDWIRVIKEQIEGLIALNDTNISSGGSSRGMSGGAGVQTGAHDMTKIKTNNLMCAECGTEDPEWVSLNLCVLVCIECSGIHRGLGSHISKMRSLKLDNWCINYLKLLEALGNNKVNSVWEANLKSFKGEITKPSSHSNRELKQEFIVAKYIKRIFIDKVSSDEANELLYKSSGDNDLLGIMKAISFGADINHRNQNENLKTPIHISCIKRNILAIELLCLFNASVDEKDADGKNPLDYICDENEESVQIIEVLINKLEKDLQS